MSAQPARVLVHGYLKLCLLSDSASLSVKTCLTGAVCHHSPRQFLFTQSRQRVEGPANLECANALVVLTLEEELDPRTCGSLPLEGGSDQGFWCLGGRRKVREGCGS